jgi:hypothetical protein
MKGESLIGKDNKIMKGDRRSGKEKENNERYEAIRK